MKKSVEAVIGIRLQAVVSLLCLAAWGRGYAEVNDIGSTALQQIAALQAEKAARTPAQLKLDSQLVYALKQAHGQAVAPGVSSLRLGAKAAADGRYLVDLDAPVTQNLLDAIAAGGGQVVSSVSNFNAIRALMPLDQTEVLAGRADVRFIQPAVPAMTRAGSVDSQGDTTHRAIQARAAFNADGSGVKVGVLSDSVDYLAQSQATGDLPPNVTVLPGQGGTGAGEGTAMMEIVHDLAPGAQLFFATGFGGSAQFAQNILDLRAAGCDIIIDDIGYANESPFQDGIIAQAVNSVTANGALYFSAAGNSGSLRHGTSGTWEGDFADGGAAGTPVDTKGGTLHSFGATPYNTVTGVGSWTVLLWSDPLGASTNDYDLFVLDSTGANIVSFSTTVQDGTKDPIEFIRTPLQVGERIVVVKASGDARFLHLDTAGGGLSIGTDGNITGHATATNAFACAAVDVHTAYPSPFSGGAANPVESFSSDGPRRVFYNADGSAITPGNYLSTGGYVRQKPDISAADGVATTLPSNSGLNPFYGTSAAAPHAGAIAALLKSYNRSLTPSAIRNILTGTALDNEAAGYDYNGGAGIIMAYQALLATPAPGLTVLSNSVSGGNGNGIVDFNECNALNIVLGNRGSADATHVSVVLFTTTPEVAIGQNRSTYPDVPIGGAATNFLPFKISTSPSFVCGTPINLGLIIKSDQQTTTNSFWLPTGQPGVQSGFTNDIPYLIPSGDTNGASSPVVVSNITSAINNVTVSVYLVEPYDGNLQLELIGPDGTTCVLAQNRGNGQNYGNGCSPNSIRTTFDDAASTPIAAGKSPFLGRFQPEQPLAMFAGKMGTNVNGIWQLHAVDRGTGYFSFIGCWSLTLSSTACQDGGGTCPGANLALGLTAAPDPVYLGGNLVYTIGVTNSGPSVAKGVTLSQSLPPSLVYLSATPSQGTVSFANGTFTASVGSLGLGATASVRVTVLPTALGAVYSTATVTSLEPEVDPADNSATVATQVNAPAADLAVGLAAAPNPALVGGVLTYSVAVTNFGPVTASGATVTVALPPSVVYSLGSASQGTVTLQPGNRAVCSFGSLGVNRRATATLQVSPSVVGTVTATATAAANQNDPFQSNNSASVSTGVGPAADLEVSIEDKPDPVVQGGQLLYTITVLNHGPSIASSVVLNGSLAGGLTVNSNYVSQGTPLTFSNSTFVGNLSALASGAKATVLLYGTPTVFGTNLTTVSVASPESDPNPANNSAVAATIVTNPFVAIVPAGARLAAESFRPANGAIDIGETVTVRLRLMNVGNVSLSNILTATLLAGNGVSQIEQPTTQTDGAMGPGLSFEAPFTFTATGTNGGTVTATLQLSDGHGYSTNASFVFALPNAVTFANTNLISIVDNAPADPYPAGLNVAGVSGQVTKVTATLAGLSHTYPHDVNVLLVGPTGARTLLMSHAAYRTKNLSDVTLTFDDAATDPLPASSDLFSGPWQPTAYAPPSFPSNAPAPPYPVALSTFNGVNPNGQWSLYAYDDVAGDQGQIARGWSLTFTTVNPIEQLADLGLTGTLTPSPVHVADTMVCTFVVSNAGPATANSVMFTNVLPAAATLMSAANSLQNTCSVDNGLVSCSLGSMSSGAVATVTLVLQPTATGWLTNRASVSATEVDLHLSDNSLALAANVVSNYADLGVSQMPSANPAVAGGSLESFVLAVTNAGPNPAVNVSLTNVLPPGFTYVSATPTPLTGTNGGGPLTWSLGNLEPASVRTVTVTATPVGLGFGTNLVLVAASGSVDTNLEDNASSLVVTNLSPVVAAGVSLVAESFSPLNGSVEPGERVSVSLSLANAGLLDIPNLVATLQPTGGITSPSAAQAYGLLAHGGTAVARTFSFTAGPPTDGLYVATLALADGTKDLGTVTFTFTAPSSGAFSSGNAIIIPDHGAAAPYPAQLNVSGLSGLVSKVTVTFHGFTHAFPSDVNVVLVNPAGAAALLMSHCGGGVPVNNVSFTLDDAAKAVLPASTLLADGGLYRPAAYNGAVTLPGAVPAPYGGSLAALNGSSPNGTWKLYVYDDSMGDGGTLANWSLDITTVQAVNPVADLAVRLSASPGSVFQLSTVTYSISVTNQGPATATGVVLTDVLPAGVSVKSATASQGVPVVANGTVTLNLDSLDAGAGASVTLKVAPAQAGSLLNRVGAVLNEMDLNLANNSAQATTLVQVPQPARLAIQRNGTQLQVTLTAQPGETYSLQATTDLGNPNAWSSVLTTQAPANGVIHYQTPGMAGQRYYRAVRIP